MSKKSVRSYRRSHPGSKIQTAVTTKPSKLKKGSKSAKRRKSFCARMRGMKKHRTGAKTARDPNSNINKSLRRWHCESIEDMRNLITLAEQRIAEEKKRLDPKCWTGYKKQGTKMKGGVRVNNCVPKESVEEASSPAQQAAIAISMKKAGKKPKQTVKEEANVVKTNNYDQWSNKVEQRGGTVYPQKNRTHLVAQSWDGETIGEYDLKTNQGWFMTTGISEMNKNEN